MCTAQRPASLRPTGLCACWGQFQGAPGGRSGDRSRRGAVRCASGAVCGRCGVQGEATPSPATHLWLAGKLCLLDLSDHQGVPVPARHVSDDVFLGGCGLARANAGHSGQQGGQRRRTAQRPAAHAQTRARAHAPAYTWRSDHLTHIVAVQNTASLPLSSRSARGGHYKHTRRKHSVRACRQSHSTHVAVAQKRHHSDP